jgi:type VI secretion system secreted protein Hcp
MRRKLSVVIVVVAFLVVAAGEVHATGYLKYEGVNGESKDKDHVKWTDILAWRWERTKGEQAGRGGCGPAKQTDLVITKALDSTTPEFLQLVDDCSAEREVILDVPLPPRTGDDPTLRRFMRITMMDVVVTRVTMGNDGSGPDSTEEVAFKFRDVRMEEIAFDRED